MFRQNDEFSVASAPCTEYNTFINNLASPNTDLSSFVQDILLISAHRRESFWLMNENLVACHQSLYVDMQTDPIAGNIRCSVSIPCYRCKY